MREINKVVFTFTDFRKCHKQVTMYRAVYDFNSRQAGVLSFKKDDVFQVSEKIDEHWLMGKNKSGDTGLVPASYLEIQESQVQR